MRNTAWSLAAIVFLTTVVRHAIAQLPAVNLTFNLIIGLALAFLPNLCGTRRGLTIAGYCLVLLIDLIVVVPAALHGGLRAPILVTLPLVPLFGHICLGPRGGLAAAVVAAASVGVLLALHDRLPLPSYPERFAAVASFMTLVGVGVASLIGFVYERGRRQAERQIYDYSSKVLQSAKLSSLGEMAAGIAHEVNNPLTVISGLAQSLKRKVESGTVEPRLLAQDLARVEQTVDRIARIVKGLLLFARPRREDLDETVSMARLFADCVDLCGERIRQAGIELKVDPGKDLQVSGGHTQLMQVILNLLGNAVDAVEPLREKWIVLKAADSGDRVEISVTDSGGGIRPDIAGNLMQPFFSTKPVGKGTGLGLSVSKGIVEAHGGELRYDAESPQTRFVFSLAIDRKDSPAGHQSRAA